MQRINEDIKSGRFKQVYLLYGEERYLVRQYRDRLGEAIRQAYCPENDTMNVHFYEGKDINVGRLIDLAETLPFLADRRIIFVDNSTLFKSGGEAMAQYLESPCETTVFVFTESEVDRRSRLFKVVQALGRAVEFKTQDEATLKRWVAGMVKKEGKQISMDTVTLFLQKTGTDMNNIRMELEKLISYCLPRDRVEAADVEAVCTNMVSSRIFDMLDAVANKKPEKAMELYYELLALKEPPMRILFLIARQCNMLMQVKELKAKGFDNKAIGERTGLPAFVVGKYAAQAGRFRAQDLSQAVKKCVEAEETVKTGRMDDVMSVEILILSVL